MMSAPVIITCVTNQHITDEDLMPRPGIDNQRPSTRMRINFAGEVEEIPNVDEDMQDIPENFELVTESPSVESPNIGDDEVKTKKGSALSRLLRRKGKKRRKKKKKKRDSSSSSKGKNSKKFRKMLKRKKSSKRKKKRKAERSKEPTEEECSITESAEITEKSLTNSLRSHRSLSQRSHKSSSRRQSRSVPFEDESLATSPRYERSSSRRKVPKVAPFDDQSLTNSPTLPKHTSSRELVKKQSTRKKKRTSSSRKLLEKEEDKDSSRKRKGRSKLERGGSSRRKVKSARKLKLLKSSSTRIDKPNLDKAFLATEFKRNVRKLIIINLFFEESAYKEVEAENNSDMRSFQRSTSGFQLLVSQLDSIDFEDENEDEDVNDDPPVEPPVSKPVPVQRKSCIAIPNIERNKREVSWSLGEDLFHIKFVEKLPESYKRENFYTKEEITKFRFEKFMEDNCDEFELIEEIEEEDEIYEVWEEEIIYYEDEEEEILSDYEIEYYSEEEFIIHE